MRCILTVALLIVSFAGSLVAQTVSPIPEKRLVYSKDIDFYGADLTNLFDTTQAACERACLSNAQCSAFTFNQKSNACFPKSGVSEKQIYEGALSAEVYRVGDQALNTGATRVADLSFLSQQDRDAALVQAEKLGALHPGGQWTVQVLLDAVRDRRAEKNNKKEFIDFLSKNKKYLNDL